MINNSNSFNEEESTLFKMNPTLDSKIVRFKKLRDSVIAMIGLNRYVTSQGVCNGARVDVVEVKNVLDLFKIEEEDIRQFSCTCHGLSDRDVMEILKKNYAIVVHESNNDNVLNVRESYIYVNFKKIAYNIFLAIGKELPGRIGIIYSVKLYMVQQIASRNFTGISDLLDAEEINELYALELTNETQQAINSSVSSLNYNEALSNIVRLLVIMNGEDFKHSEFNTEASYKLKSKLETIINNSR